MSDKSLASELASFCQELTDMCVTLQTILQPLGFSVREIKQGGKNVGPEIYCMQQFAPMHGFQHRFEVRINT